MRNIISNTSCLIVLDNINMLEILRELYGKIRITEEVYNEFGKSVPGWIEVIPVLDRKCVKVVNSVVDLGEASTIALAIETENSVMILDDLKARRLAKKLELSFTGTIGVLLRARERNYIESLVTVLERLRSQGFRISKEMENELLKYD